MKNTEKKMRDNSKEKYFKLGDSSTTISTGVVISRKKCIDKSGYKYKILTLKSFNENGYLDMKYLNEFEQGFWYGRELAEVLEYIKWGNFKKVIEKTKVACENSDINVLNHFADAGKTIDMPKGAQREIDDPRDYALFQNRGYQGLYGGLGAKEIKRD